MERVTRERQQQEKEFWEKSQAELRVAEQKLEMEVAAKGVYAKLPKLKIAPSKEKPSSLQFAPRVREQILGPWGTRRHGKDCKENTNKPRLL